MTPDHPEKVTIDWEIEAQSEAGAFDFDVERSGSPGGPWTTIATSVGDVRTYDDPLDTESVNTLSLNRSIYYRVRAIPPSGELNAFYSQTVNLEGHSSHTVMDPIPGIGYRVIPDGQYEPDPNTSATNRPVEPLTRNRLLKHAILRHEYIALKALYGVEYYLLKRRHFGTRCSECYDPISRSVAVSDCNACYGTSWTDGYYTPILILGKRLVAPVKSDVTQHAKTNVHVVRIQFLDFPRIDEEDILVEKYRNRRFLVLERYNTTLKGIIVHQTVTTSELERQAVEYNIPVSL